MNRTPVTSSFLKSIGHDGDVLEVELQSGKVFRYTGVSAAQHAAFIGAKSVGSHFGQHIRGKFDHAVVAPEPAPQNPGYVVGDLEEGA